MEIEIATPDLTGKDQFLHEVSFTSRMVTAPQELVLSRGTTVDLPEAWFRVTYGDEEQNVCTYVLPQVGAEEAVLTDCSRMVAGAPAPLPSTFARLEVFDIQDAIRTRFRASLHVSAPCPGQPALTEKYYQYPESVTGAYVVMLDPARLEGTSVDDLAEQYANKYGATLRHVFHDAFVGFSLRNIKDDDAKEIASDPRVKLVESVKLARAAGVKGFGTPTSPAFSHLDRTDQRAGLNDFRDYLYKYPESAQQSERAVYVLDNGVRRDHQDFSLGSGAYKVKQDDTAFDIAGRNFALCEESGVPDSHGTAVASLVGGNFAGSATRVTLYDVPVMGGPSGGACGFASADEVAKGIDAVLAYGVTKPAVIVMALGVENDPQGFLNASVLKALQRHVVVASAGNNRKSIDSIVPANIGGVITVSASDLADRFWDDPVLGGSNYGPGIDLIAPGDTSAAAYSGYAGFKGTSAAGPLVAGAVALALDAVQVTTFNGVRDFLVNSATLGRVTEDLRPLNGTPNRILFVEGKPLRIAESVINSVGSSSNPTMAFLDAPGRLLVGLEGHAGSAPSRILYRLDSKGHPVQPIAKQTDDRCVAAALTFTNSVEGYLGCIRVDGRGVLRKVDDTNEEVVDANWPIVMPGPSERPLALSPVEGALGKVVLVTYDYASGDGRIKLIHQTGAVQQEGVLPSIPGYGPAAGLAVVSGETTISSTVTTTSVWVLAQASKEVAGRFVSSVFLLTYPLAGGFLSDPENPTLVVLETYDVAQSATCVAPGWAMGFGVSAIALAADKVWNELYAAYSVSHAEFDSSMTCRNRQRTVVRNVTRGTQVGLPLTSISSMSVEFHDALVAGSALREEWGDPLLADPGDAYLASVSGNGEVRWQQLEAANDWESYGAVVRSPDANQCYTVRLERGATVIDRLITHEL